MMYRLDFAKGGFSMHSNLESKQISFFHNSLVFIKAIPDVEKNSREVERILVGLAIEKTLLQMGRTVFERVEDLFHERYQCTIMDAYDNPQYLGEILKEVFGKSHTKVINSIGEFLINFKYEHPIEEFIEKMSK